MNIPISSQGKRGTVFMVLAFSSVMIAACAMQPTSPQGAAEARNQLTALQNDPNLAEHARVEIREAEAAVRTAEQPLSEDETALGEHRVYMADRAVAIAKAKARTRYAQAQRTELAEAREEARLQARTREVEEARSEAAQARRAADAAQSAEARAQARAEQREAEFQRKIEALEAEVTDRGVVLTLGDVLFATGSAELQSGDSSNLNKLVGFLKDYPERHVQIEGHTDNTGSAQLNRELSQRRADAVRYYLTQQGIDSQRLSASGMGMDQPVASNDNASGRRQNRRVEIIIDNPSHSSQ